MKRVCYKIYGLFHGSITSSSSSTISILSSTSKQYSRKLSYYSNNLNHNNDQKQYLYRRLLQIIEAYRRRGHYASNLDPLKDAKTILEGSSAHNNLQQIPDIIQFLINYDLHSDGNKILNLEVFIDILKCPNVNQLLDEKFLDLNDDIHCNDMKTTLWSINEIIEALTRTYCNKVGIELAHIDNPVQYKWLLQQIEHSMTPSTSRWTSTNPKEQQENLLRLIKADHSATFIKKKYPSSKVFGIEGCESLLPGIWSLLTRAVNVWGLESLELGMAHRGRINILHNLLGKSLKSICNDFSELDIQYGDVKYHLGTRAEVSIQQECEEGEGDLNNSNYYNNNLEKRNMRKNKVLKVSLAANPSHLEAVNSVVLGKCKAKQLYSNDTNMRRTMPILLHGDASFAGQGVVSECLELSNMPNYTVGGCIHIIINNQIGFTTDPKLSRTSYHCTDIAKGVGAPIFHVNGDDVDAVVNVFKLAIDYRMTFNKDIIVDIVCYRRHGHNELDEPMITHPLMYKTIQKHPTTLEIYLSKLINQNIITKEAYLQLSQQIYKEYEYDYQESKQYHPDPLEWMQSNWQGEAIGTILTKRPFNQTGVRKHVLDNIGKALIYVPEHINVHKDVKKLIQQRKDILATGKGVTWGFAEALAFGSLMSHFSPNDQIIGRFNNSNNNTSNTTNNYDSIQTNSNNSNNDNFKWTNELKMIDHPTVHIRLSGQDCIRGTFNQRHAAIYCQDTNQAYWQLNNLTFTEQAMIDVCNSSLSEFAILGFEYGYSLSNEMALTIFEAQFGDFANNAQCIIDNFIASGEHKWNNKSSLVLLLPHGYDGQGPDHSSARLERFLALIDDDPDHIPGKSIPNQIEIIRGFERLDTKKTGKIDKQVILQMLFKSVGVDDTNATIVNENEKHQIEVMVDEMMKDLGVRNDGKYKNVITRKMYIKTMETWLMKYSERKQNMIIVVPSTPAQYFHVLRRQIHRSYAKPLIVMSAKWLLHHKLCTSNISELCEGTYFQRVITEGGRGDNMNERTNSITNNNITSSDNSTNTTTNINSSINNINDNSNNNSNTTTKSSNNTNSNKIVPDLEIKRIIFCSGKIFYHLYHERQINNINNITIVRIEQISPFPYDIIMSVLQQYRNADIVWCQEEPKNMGAYSYVKPRLETAIRGIIDSENETLQDTSANWDFNILLEEDIHSSQYLYNQKYSMKRIIYIGRQSLAASATGGMKEHLYDQKHIIKTALDLNYNSL